MSSTKTITTKEIKISGITNKPRSLVMIRDEDTAMHTELPIFSIVGIILLRSTASQIFQSNLTARILIIKQEMKILYSLW